MTTFSRRSLTALAAACALALLGTSAAVAQQRPKITVSSLTLPVFNPLVWNIMKARGLDAKHGFELEAKPYPSISAFYAAFSTGETEVVIGGPTILQKLYQEGVPLRIFGTGFTLSDLVVFAKDPNIKSLADLKGKHIELGKDITVVNANFAVARAQLEADRVDAALVIEPLASITLRQNPGWTIIFNGAQGWREITGQDGWEIVPAIRAETIGRVPQAPKMLLAALQDVANILHKETDAADKIAVDTTGHSQGRGGQRAAANDRAAGVGSSHPPVDHGHDAARRQGRLLPNHAGQQDHLCTLRNIERRASTRSSRDRPSSRF